MELTLRQQEGLRIAVERYRNKEPYTVISGYAGAGKAQPIETIIPTPNGKKKIGELNIGDYVFDRLGKPTKVLGIYPQGKRKKYEITLADGRKTICADDHLWSYYTSRGNLNTKTTQEMLNSGLKNSSGFKYKIPNNQAVEYPEQEFIIDPYMMGVFLGDGCCKERYLTLSSETDEIPKIIGEIIGATPYKSSINNYSWTFEWGERTETIKWCNSNRIEERKKPKTIDYFQLYEKYLLCYAQEKDIPPEYKIGSIQQRLELIQGLLDTDGSIGQHDQNRFNVKFTSTSIKLVQSLQEILYSLGYSSTITEDNRNEKYTNGICYGLNINIPNEEKYKLFRLKRKKDIAEKAKEFHKHKDYNKISIIDIQPLQEETDMICIYVDNNEHLYLTNDYIVTHNTTLVKFIIAALDLNPEKDVAYIAFTGKAATVLSKKGNPNAMTAHKLLYKAYQKPDGTFFFKPNPPGSLGYKVIVLDECSMLPKGMWDRLLSHGVYIIACGDPAQLPPINPEDDNHALDKPHIFLDEIMRQAQDSEIIRLSMWVREGKDIKDFNCSNEQVKILSKNELVSGVYKWADQILCATNATRNNINTIMRKYKGFGFAPEIGDKIVSLSNHWDISSTNGNNVLTNGSIGIITDFNIISEYFPRFITPEPVDYMYTSMKIEDEDDYFYNLPIDYNTLLKNQKTLNIKQNMQIKRSKQIFLDPPYDFAYAYALTVHKFQGSEAPRILLIEENFPFAKEEHMRWLYTGITRASSRLVVVKK